MEYPSITQYKEAVLFQESFEAEELQCLRPVMNGNEPVMTSGNFAVVFKMHNPKTGETFALKCFTQDQDGRAEAYRQIETELRYVDSPYFISLHYIDKGIWAGDYDSAFPVLLMPWVDGEPLDRHVAALVKTDPKRLLLVAYKFSVMASWLVNQPFAHGDIKPDNILVRADGSMVLVDYDGLFVPSMLGAPSREAGPPAFRHPNRPSMPFDERIDAFPLACINLSLYLIALKPGLLQKYGAKDRLLFTETDYQNLSQCKLLKDILALCHDVQLQRLYALFFIALSEGSLERCENRLMLLRPPHQDFGILRQPYANHVPVEDVEFENEITPQQDLTFNVNGVQFRMKYVEGGTFMMGAPDTDSDAFTKEKPAHNVTLDSFYIAETQVTWELWEVVMGNIDPFYHVDDNKRPVVGVTWDDCWTFITKLNEISGKRFALPTEAQWEYAARGGKKSKGYKYAGGDNIDDVAWWRNNSTLHTHRVAQKKPNELGLYDMTGNVWEWCMDRFSSKYYSKSSKKNPQGPAIGESRVLRGGCTANDARYCRLSCRGFRKSIHKIFGVGLRLMLVVNDTRVSM